MQFHPNATGTEVFLSAQLWSRALTALEAQKRPGPPDFTWAMTEPEATWAKAGGTQQEYLEVTGTDEKVAAFRLSILEGGAKKTTTT